ncbi:MAG: pilus assembly protein [Beijerinckiaceae bacterium]|nr:pilus assembly protein [Beijerinckiaceae bacterium]MDO9439992.1 pilus assembly protein [Beijerinckiaceae bacterium]
MFKALHIKVRSEPGRPGLRRVIIRFGEDRRGATAIEFGFVAIPFIGLLFAILETAFVFFTTEGLESAVADAARTIMTGQVQSTSIANAAQFRDQMICNPTPPRKRLLPDYVDCTKLKVDVRQASAFSTADMTRSFYTNPTMTYSPGGGGCIVVVRAAYPMPVFFPLLTVSGLSTAGQVSYDGGMKHMLVGTAAFRNEPFPGTLPSC